MTESNIVAIAPLGAPIVTTEQLDLVRRTIAPGATPDELRLFVYDCTRRGVHPLDRLIHFTKRGGRYTPITGIDYLRSRAGDTGAHAGTTDAEFGPIDEHGYPEFARVTVYRIVNGDKASFTATARWKEYYPGTGTEGFMWRKMPHTMLAKVAESLALRKGFPAELAGLYERSEMDQAKLEEAEIRRDTPLRIAADAPMEDVTEEYAAETPVTDTPPTKSDAPPKRGRPGMRKFWAKLRQAVLDHKIAGHYYEDSENGKAKRRILLSNLLKRDIEDVSGLTDADWHYAAEQLDRFTYGSAQSTEEAAHEVAPDELPI
jgi:phage recombination protein Bet